MPHIGSISATGEVGVVASVFVVQQVIAGIINAPKRQCWPSFISFGGMVIDDVQNDFDPCRMQRADHRLEFLRHQFRIVCGAITRFRSKKTKGVIPPIIDSLLIGQEFFIDMKMDWQQFDRCHAKFLQIIDGWGACQSRVGSSQLLGNFSHQFRKALHVQFVDDCPFPGDIRPLIFSPCESGIDDQSQGGIRGRVAIVEGKILITLVFTETEQCFIPFQHPTNSAGIRVKQDFVRVESKTVLRRIRAVNSKSVKSARFQVGKVGMKDVVGSFGQFDPFRFLMIIGRIEQAQFDLGRIVGEQSDINACAIPNGSQRIRMSWPDSHCKPFESKKSLVVMNSFCRAPQILPARTNEETPYASAGVDPIQVWKPKANYFPRFGFEEDSRSGGWGRGVASSEMDWRVSCRATKYLHLSTQRLGGSAGAFPSRSKLRR